MTDIEAKARDMVRKEDKNGLLNFDAAIAALCRAIEQHEAFKQEVSDAVAKAIDHIKDGRSASAAGAIGAFVIRKPKPDPLLGIVEWLGGPVWGTREEYVKEIHAALEARGLEIREKGQ